MTDSNKLTKQYLKVKAASLRVGDFYLRSDGYFTQVIGVHVKDSDSYSGVRHKEVRILYICGTDVRKFKHAEDILKGDVDVWIEREAEVDATVPGSK